MEWFVRALDPNDWRVSLQAVAARPQSDAANRSLGMKALFSIFRVRKALEREAFGRRNASLESTAIEDGQDIHGIMFR